MPSLRRGLNKTNLFHIRHFCIGSIWLFAYLTTYYSDSFQGSRLLPNPQNTLQLFTAKLHNLPLFTAQALLRLYCVRLSRFTALGVCPWLDCIIAQRYQNATASNMNLTQFFGTFLIQKWAGGAKNCRFLNIFGKICKVIYLHTDLKINPDPPQNPNTLNPPVIP